MVVLPPSYKAGKGKKQNKKLIIKLLISTKEPEKCPESLQGCVPNELITHSC